MGRLNSYQRNNPRLRNGQQNYRVKFSDGREQVVRATSRADAIVKSCGPDFRGRPPQVELANLKSPKRRLRLAKAASSSKAKGKNIANSGDKAKNNRKVANASTGRTRTCPRCGRERSIYSGFPRGPNKPCRMCLFGPPPRPQFIPGGAPGLGKRHGKRR